MIKVCFEYDEKSNKKNVFYRVMAYIFLTIMTIVVLFPFYLLLINASRSNAQLQSGFTMIPSSMFLANFKNVWNDTTISMGKGIINSFVVSSLSALVTAYFSLMTAYSIHVYEFKFKRVILAFILAIMMIPTQVSTVGYVQIINQLGLTNNFIPLILPAVVSPLTFFYMIQYMKTGLPIEVIEAARVDGSNEFYTFNKIVIPMLKPALCVQAIFAFVASWNNYFVPALLITDKNKKTLPIMMATLRSTANSGDYDLGKIYMFVLISILPVVIIYLILSKSIIKGVSNGYVSNK